MVDFSLTNLVVLSGSLQIRFSGLEGVSGVIRSLSNFGSPIEELGNAWIFKSGRLGKLGNAWIFRSGKGVGCYWCWSHFGSPIEEKVSDLGGLEGLESLEMHGLSGLEGMSDVI